MPSSNKPSVFVSSTISDFGDLRSALKFWLGEMGCEVWMSEFNDFERQPDLKTFDSCFDLVRRSDYFVLLVGGRRGSLYNDTSGVSVTQKEFRVARKSFAKSGRPIPVVFVRSDVLRALNEWRAMRGSEPKDGAGPDAQCRSQVLEDPSFVERFVADIDNAEPFTRQGGSGTLWRYEFSSFSELVQALRVNLGLHRPLRRQALLANLRWELEDNVRDLCLKTPGGGPFPAYLWLSRLRHQSALPDIAWRQDAVTLELDRARDVLAFWIAMPEGHSLQSSMLDQAILSGEFLEYSHELGGFAEDSLSRGLRTLANAIRSYRSIYSLIREQDAEFDGPCRASKSQQARISFRSYPLLLLCRAHDLLEDITCLSARLLRYVLDPHSGFQLPSPNPVCPIPGMDAKIAKERATHNEVEAWIRDLRYYCQLARVELSQSELDAILDEYPDLRAELSRLLDDARGECNSA